MAFPTGWNRKCSLTIDHTKVSADQSNLPVLFTVDNLPSEMFDADGSYPANSDGGDIRFSSDSAGATQLPVEVVYFLRDNTPANGLAEVWVNVTSVSSTVDTVVYVWYNNSSATMPAVTDTYGRNAVWSNSYKLVHHGNNTNNGDMTDATGNGWGTTAAASYGSPYETTGVWSGGKALALVDTSACAMVGGSTGITLPFSFEFWNYYNRAANIWCGGIGQSSWDFNTANCTMNAADNGAWRLMVNNWGMQFTLTHPLQSWQQVAVTYDGTNALSYGSGTYHDTYNHTEASVNNTQQYYYGSNWDWTWPGYFDEVRVSTVVRSASWISSSYNSQNSPSTFITEGTPASVGYAHSYVIWIG
jgi:hypothetical protein